MKCRICIWLLAGLFLAWTPVHAVPGKSYSDMTVSNANADHVTGYLFWKNSGFDQYTGINISDAAAYSPEQVFTNTGNITLNNVSISAPFNSINGIGNDNANILVRNQGDIYIDFGTSDTGLAAYGISTLGRLENSGKVTLDLHRQSFPYSHIAIGVLGDGPTLVNSGTIDVSTRSDVLTSASALTDMSAYGIRFTGNSRMVNSGTVSVTARGGTATGATTRAEATAMGIYTTSDLTHTGRITVAAHAGKERPNASSPFTSDDATAYGIETDAGLVLDSRGLIQVAAVLSPGLSGGTAQAYQLHVDSGNTTLVGYAMEVENQSQLSSVYNGTIKVDSGSQLIFQNTVLYLSVAEDVDGQVTYEIPMLVEGAAVADQFSSIGAMPPEYKVSLINGNGAALQQVKIEFAPQESFSLVSSGVRNEFNSQAHAIVGDQMLNGLLADVISPDALTLVAEPDLQKHKIPIPRLAGRSPVIPALSGPGTHRVFAVPVLLISEDVSEKGYRAENYGILAGYTRRLGKDLFIGGHAAVNQVDMEFSGEGAQFRTEESQVYSMGLHGAWRHPDQWLTRGILSGFFSRTDYADRSPANRESADYDALGARLDLSLGRILEGDGYTLLPETGLSLTWEKREAFETENLTHADVAHGTMEEWEAFWHVGLKGFTQVPLGSDWRLTASAGVALTQALTDNRSGNTMAVGQIHRHVTHQSHRTLISPKLGISISNDGVELATGYSGGFSHDARNDLFWVQFGVRF